MPRRGRARQHRHLHRRRPRDDRQRADLDALPAVAVAAMARARRSGNRRGFDPQAPRPGETLPVVTARGVRGSVAALSARRVPQPRGDRRGLVGGRHAFPPGTVVTVSPFVLHRHRRLWSDPDVFDPERFLGKNRERDRPLRLHSVRRRPARLHRPEFRHSGGAHRARASLRTLRFDLAPGHVSRRSSV